MGGFIVPVIEVVVAILDIYWWLVVIQAVVSWLIAFNIINTYSRPVAMVLDFLYRATEPALATDPSVHPGDRRSPSSRRSSCC